MNSNDNLPLEAEASSAPEGRSLESRSAVARFWAQFRVKPFSHHFFHPLVLALLGYGCYSVKDVLTRVALGNVSILVVQAVTYVVGLCAVLLYVGMRGRWAALRAHRWWVPLVAASLLLLNDLTFLYVLPRLPMVTFFVLLMTTPLVVGVLGWVFLKEHLRFWQMVAIVTSFAGAVWMVMAGHKDADVGAVPFDAFVYFMALITILISATRGVFLRGQAEYERPIYIVFVVCIIGVLAFVPMALQQVWGNMAQLAAHPDFSRDMAFAAVGGVFNILAFGAIVQALKGIRAAYVQSMQYSQMIWVTVAGYFIWQEVPNVGTVIGGALVVVSGLFIALTARLRRVGN